MPANVTVQVASVQPNQDHYLTPLTLDAASDTLVRQNSEVRDKQTVPVMSHSARKTIVMFMGDYESS